MLKQQTLSRTLGGSHPHANITSTPTQYHGSFSGAAAGCSRNSPSSKFGYWNLKIAPPMLFSSKRLTLAKLRYGDITRTYTLAFKKKYNNYGVVATLIKKKHPQTKIDSELACSDEREVVSTQIKLVDTIIDIHNTYSRPTVGPIDADWIDRLVVRGRHTVLAGDFNARHTAWGYPDNNARGKNIKKACVAAHLQLCNNPETTTRLAHSTNQNDTSPDLSGYPQDCGSNGTCSRIPWAATTCPSSSNSPSAPLRDGGQPLPSGTPTAPQ